MKIEDLEGRIGQDFDGEATLTDDELRKLIAVVRAARNVRRTDNGTYFSEGGLIVGPLMAKSRLFDALDAMESP